MDEGRPAPVMTLAEFLLARIAEDEAVATDAKDDHADADGHWWWDGVDFEGSWPTSEPPKDDKSYAFQSWEVMAERLDPARVLAECEARRRLVGYAAFMLKAWDDKPGGAYPDMTRRERHTANVILEALALPYADHPDYRDEWRP